MFLRRLFRRKQFTETPLDTQLRRCLSTFDITMIGVGQTVGAGIYVLAGTVIRNTAGPSIVLSFLFAGFAAFLSALCYAEFGARFPKAGSAYTYAYIGCGEIWAFIIGWNVVLENMLSAAVVARAWSGYMNVLADGAIKNFTIEHTGELSIGLFADYLDLLAFLIAVILCILMATGARGSTGFNSIITVINIIMICVVTMIGFTFADLKNWTGHTPDGSLNFFPYGWQGTIAGASACFFSFIGFDGLATAGEEAREPTKSIPRATFLCMGIVTTVYVLMSAALSLMLPYTEMDPEAAFVTAFKSKGMMLAVICVTIGAICGMTGSMFGALFALPRCVYAMAEDGLIFKLFANVNKWTKVPVNAIAVFGLMTAIMAALFNVETLVDFLSLGTLMAYTMVAVCVILLRYSHHDNRNYIKARVLGIPTPKFILGLSNLNTVSWGLIVIIAGFVGFGLTFTTGLWFRSRRDGWLCVSLCASISLLGFLWISMHRQNGHVLPFRVPLVPILPVVSIFLNTMMLLNLNRLAWLRFGVWIGIGLIIYLLYGLSHSEMEAESRRDRIQDLSLQPQNSIRSRKTAK